MKYGQNRNSTNANIKETGITLIALVVSIIILIILSAIVVGQIAGENSIISAAKTSVNNYAVAQYIEQIEQVIQSTILKDSILGEITTITSIAEALEEESWVKSAIAEETTHDIIITTTDGYVFQVYYDETTGEVRTEVIGIDDGSAVPTINATYDETKAIITANASCTDGIAKIELIYQNEVIDTSTNDEESQNFEANFSVTSTGWYEVKATSTEGKTRYTLIQVSNIVIAPTITLSGTQGNDGYYIGDVTVRITDSASSSSTAVSQIKYTVTGANEIAETTVSGTSTSFTIVADGTSTITAQAISSTGKVSNTATEIVLKDATAPQASITIDSYSYINKTISFTATGEDAGTGIYSYEIQMSTTSDTEEFTTIYTQTTNATSITYTYPQLEIYNETYYFRVIVADNAGNKTTSSVEERSIIGQYVDYTPTSGTFSDHVGTTYSGASNNSSLSTDTSLKWRILFADENTLTLIADTTAHKGFTLYGYQGYNNGVLLLNNACKAMYSNSGLGATGRNLAISDIESVSSYHGASLAEYTPTNQYYPTIFQYEEYGSIDGLYTGTLKRNVQTDYYSGKEEATTLKGKFTYYSYKISTNYMNSKYVELFIYQAGTTTNLSNNYWLSSRCVNFNNDTAIFRIFYIVRGDVNANYLFSSDDSDYSGSYYLRPVVEVTQSSVIVGTTGSGTSEDPYSITAK